VLSEESVDVVLVHVGTVLQGSRPAENCGEQDLDVRQNIALDNCLFFHPRIAVHEDDENVVVADLGFDRVVRILLNTIFLAGIEIDI